jgi:hypothetical protein
VNFGTVWHKGTVWHEWAVEKVLKLLPRFGVSRRCGMKVARSYPWSYRGDMSVVKRSVSFDAELWDELVQEAGAGPVSPLVNDALAHYLRRQRGLAAVAEYEAEYGAFTEEELAEADRVLDEASVVDLTATSKRKRAKTTAGRTPRRRS